MTHMSSLTDTTERPLAAEVPAEQGSREDRWPRIGLALLLVATAAFWTVGLSKNGWANAFYAAAVQAGTKSWKAFLFGSSDAANAITVDKPPASLWPMEISARIFGVNTWSIQLPQVLLGVASVALLYVIIKKRFGPVAGLIAGLALALTPVATLMFRYDNPDALLIFLMVAAVWAVSRAVDDGRTRWLVLCGVLVGFGFLTKQLQVLLVVPGLGLTYLIAGPPRLRTRLLQLLAALGSMLVAAGWWVLLVELWPASSRPYIGGSSTNSFLDLTFGYNGFGRLLGGDGDGIGSGGAGGPAAGGGSSPFGEPGLARMFTGESGAQISWLLPAALLLLIVGLVACGRSSRTDPQRAQYLVWGGWLVGTAGVFSFMSGLYHDYYTVALAPAVAALVGIGTADLWRRRQQAWAAWILIAVAAITGGWAWVLLGRTPDFVPWLRWGIVGATVLAVLGLVVATVLPATAPRRADLKVWAAGLAVVAALAGPLSYCVQTVSTSHTGGVVTAGPQIPGSTFGPPANQGADSHAAAGMGAKQVSSQMVGTLGQDADKYTWVAATPGSTDAGYYQLATGDPVMALGGFGSSDPAPTLEQFQAYVADGRVHYYIESAGMTMPVGSSDEAGGQQLMPPGANDDNEANKIKAWVKQHYTAVTVDDVSLYDLTRPAAG